VKKALICGISGQDGSYLARFLIGKGYEVWGTSRDTRISRFRSLVKLGIIDQVLLESVSLTDFRSVLRVFIKVQPDEVYNLARQSSVGLSFEQPVETLDSISVGTLNLLEAIRFTSRSTRFYNSCSSECFGDTNGMPADEATPFRPRSPYGVAKCAAFWEVANYREAYGLFALSGILFNHESPLRPEWSVTKKIVTTACSIAAGSKEKLHLGNLATQRDWGYAPEYVEAMWLMLQQEHPDDYVIATGESHSVEEFAEAAFAQVGLDWHDHTVVEPTLFRPQDITFSKGNPAKARQKLGWQARCNMKGLVQIMVKAEMQEFSISAKNGADSLSGYTSNSISGSPS